MKIIKKGNPEGVWSLEVECTGSGNEANNGSLGKIPCGALLEINANDIFITESSSYADTCSDFYYTIKCPLCGSHTDIDNNLLPYSVQALAKRKRDLQKQDREM